MTALIMIAVMMALIMENKIKNAKNIYFKSRFGGKCISWV